MKYITHSDFMPSVHNLYKKNGHYRNITQRVLSVWAKTQNEAKQLFKDTDVFNIPLTHNGENRIQHCLKYNLSNNCRLITSCSQDTHIFLFLGTHEECDRWLNKNQGHDFYAKNDSGATKKTIPQKPLLPPKSTIGIDVATTEKITQLRVEIKDLKKSIEEWSDLINYNHGISPNTMRNDLESDRDFFLKKDSPFFFKKMEKISDNLKKNRMIIVHDEIEETEFLMEIFFLKIQHIDKLKQLINLTRH